jgi:DeoR/GlpR family transcriptional regulator of sugar metabolism
MITLYVEINIIRTMNTAEQRQHFILEQIEQRGSVNVIELAEQFGVSDMTIRRDLSELERLELVRRIHGGAVSARGRGYEPPLYLRNTRFQTEKRRIGQYAAGMIAEGDSVALDVGSTCYEAATHLLGMKNITILTPSLPIANLFYENADIRLILPGGIVRTTEASMIGELARRNLELIFVDRLLLGVGAVDSNAGLTEFNFDDALIKQAMIKNAKEVILLADSSKFQQIAFAHVAPLKAITHLVSDQEPPDDLLQALKDNAVTIHVVKEESVQLL